MIYLSIALILLIFYDILPGVFCRKILKIEKIARGGLLLSLCKKINYNTDNIYFAYHCNHAFTYGIIRKKIIITMNDVYYDPAYAISTIMHEIGHVKKHHSLKKYIINLLFLSAIYYSNDSVFIVCLLSISCIIVNVLVNYIQEYSADLFSAKHFSVYWRIYSLKKNIDKKHKWYYYFSHPPNKSRIEIMENYRTRLIKIMGS